MTTDRQPTIVATGLRKSYGEQTVLDGVDLVVAEGTIFALLGPNGASKTTTVQILSTLIDTDAGQARVAGHDLAGDPDSVRKAIGVTSQFSAVASRPLTCSRVVADHLEGHVSSVGERCAQHIDLPGSHLDLRSSPAGQFAHRSLVHQAARHR